MRHQIWLATDKAYKVALQQFAAKQVMLKQYQQEQLADDFSRETPLTDIAPVVKLSGDLERWSKDLNAATLLARQHPNVLSYIGFVKAMGLNEYFLNSEGSATRKGSVVYNIQPQGTSQATDGMKFDQGKAYVIVAENELPSREKLLSDSQAVIKRLEQLRTAPVVEEQYRGPVFFSADADTTLFATLVAPNVEAKKPRPGETGRTTGAFASSFRSRVLPQFVNVVDDPTKQIAAGRSLAGHYVVDDEAVKARPVTVIDQGVLKNFLIDREPIADFPKSNGHGRSGPYQRANSETGNLFVSATTPVHAAELKQQFLEACKSRGAEYCYRVEAMGARLSPELLYRVYTKDGHEELVRGAAFEQLDTRELRNGLTALGDDPTVSNFFEQFGYSVIAPSALFEELQIKRSTAGKQKLPDYPAPAMQ
jgi:TldD protein